MATISTVRELIFHDWHPTNPGSELGMNKSMIKTDKSYRAVCVCVRAISRHTQKHILGV